MTDVIHLRPGGVGDNFADALADLDGEDAPPATAAPVPDLWPTALARAVQAAVEACHAMGQLGVVAGPSGAGKSTAARAAVAAAWAAGHDASYVSMTLASAGLQPGLARVAAALGVAEARSHLGAGPLHDKLARRFRRPDALLVLDEAQHMSNDLLHGWRDLWDELAAGATPGEPPPLAILFVGTPDLADRLHGRAGGGGGGRGGRASPASSRGLEPLRGRLGVFLELDGPGPDDIAALMARLGVAGAQVRALLAHAARGHGGLHNVARLLAQGRLLAGKGKPLGLSHLRRAAELAGVAP